MRLKSQSAVCFASVASTSLSIAFRASSKVVVVFILKTRIYKITRTKSLSSLFLVLVFGTKTFLNFGSIASNTARSAGTAALCEAKAALR